MTNSNKKVFIYIAGGYSYGGWGGYSKITVAMGSHACKSWTNKKMEVLERTGRLFNGSTEKCEFSVELSRILKEYPGAIIV